MLKSYNIFYTSPSFITSQSIIMYHGIQSRTVLLFIALFASLISAFKVENGLISIGATQKAKFTCCKPAANEALIINSDKESIDLKFQILDQDTKQPFRPNQVVVLVSKQDDELEQSFIPKVDSNGNAELSIPVNKLSKNLILHNGQDRGLDINVILGDFVNANQPSLKKLASVKVNSKIVESLSKNFKQPTRFGAKPEIFHIFQKPAKQTNPVIALVFIALIVGALGNFVFTVFMHGNVNFKRFSGPEDKPIDSVYKISFIASLIALEVFFLQYYLGDSIFVLIGKTVVLAGPTVWFGSRVFRSLLQQRLKGHI